MAGSVTHKGQSLVVVFGEDEYSVKQRAAEIFRAWQQESGEVEVEVVDAQVTTVAEAERALGRLREGLQTLPFFGSGKRIWLKNCNFLGEERTANSPSVTEGLNQLVGDLGQLSGEDLRLLISAGKIDKRRGFFKALGKLGVVEEFPALEQAKDGASQAATRVRRWVEERGKEMTSEACDLLIASVGTSTRQLSNEVEKVVLYAGEATRIGEDHVRAVVSRQHHAEAFALGDALGDRDLPRVLRVLREELATIKTDRQKSEIGLLYGLITKVRVLLFLKEMLREGLIRPEQQYPRFKAQWQRLPDDAFPQDKRFNPKEMSPYLFFKALPQARRYETGELVDAMSRLLECNQRLVGSGLDEAMVLQQTLIQVVRPA